MYVVFPDSDAGTDAASPGDDGSLPAPVDDATTVPPMADAPGDDVGLDDAASGEAPDGSCSGTVAVCDPVHDTGCNPLQQCDVDPSQTTTPTGLCVFAAAPEGGPCTSTVFTESCPARSTCFGGSCRELCFCDADCPAGRCCSDTSGPPGFLLCGSCP
jgi:hypothetical protein